MTTKLQIVTDGFSAGPSGFQLKDITFSNSEAEVEDGFLPPSLNDSDQYKLLVWPRAIKNIGTEKLVVDSSQKRHLVNSGIDVVNNVWYLVLKDTNGVEYVRQKQAGILSDLDPGKGIDITVGDLTGGQYLDISSVPLGFYELGIGVDPDNQWSTGNEPVYIKFEYRLGNVRIVDAFPPTPVGNVQALAVQVADINRRVNLLEHGGINP